MSWIESAEICAADLPYTEPATSSWIRSSKPGHELQLVFCDALLHYKNQIT